LDGIQVVGRAPETFGDKVAHSVVKRMRWVESSKDNITLSRRVVQIAWLIFCRRVFDIFSGYKDVHITEDVLKQNPVPIEQLRQSGQLLSPKGWLFRFILLESFAGVPGMVAGTLRHLRSLRLLVSVPSVDRRDEAPPDTPQRKDGGWINTLLEEAENERMHLL
jgi:ubiquinol oxidase